MTPYFPLIALLVVRITHQKLISHFVTQQHHVDLMFEKATSFDSHCVTPPSHEGGEMDNQKK